MGRGGYPIHSDVSPAGRGGYPSSRAATKRDQASAMTAPGVYSSAICTSASMCPVCGKRSISAMLSMR